MSGRLRVWTGTMTAGAIAGIVSGVSLSIPSIVKWLFPDSTDFFADGSGPRWIRFGWHWLTVDWTVPAVPALIVLW